MARLYFFDSGSVQYLKVDSPYHIVATSLNEAANILVEAWETSDRLPDRITCRNLDIDLDELMADLRNDIEKELIEIPIDIDAEVGSIFIKGDRWAWKTDIT